MKITLHSSIVITHQFLKIKRSKAASLDTCLASSLETYFLHGLLFGLSRHHLLYGNLLGFLPCDLHSFLSSLGTLVLRDSWHCSKSLLALSLETYLYSFLENCAVLRVKKTREGLVLTPDLVLYH